MIKMSTNQFQVDQDLNIKYLKYLNIKKTLKN